MMSKITSISHRNGTRQSSPQQCSKTYNKRPKLKNKQTNTLKKSKRCLKMLTLARLQGKYKNKRLNTSRTQVKCLLEELIRRHIVGKGEHTHGSKLQQRTTDRGVKDHNCAEYGYRTVSVLSTWKGRPDLHKRKTRAGEIQTRELISSPLFPI